VPYPLRRRAPAQDNVGGPRAANKRRRADGAHRP
jgi:hypothetical protein